jgi:hypothetical protein
MTGTASWVFLRGQQKHRAERPDAAEQTGHGPAEHVAPAVMGDDGAEDGVEGMDERRGWQQQAGLNVGSNNDESGEVADQLVEIHEPLLTLRLDS